MITRLASALVIVALLGSTVSCYRNVTVLKDEAIRPYEPQLPHTHIPELRPPTHDRIVAIVLPSGEEILFDETGGWLTPMTESIEGRDVNGAPVSVALDDILYLRVRRLDAVEVAVVTVFAVAAMGAAIYAIVLATKESCPFVYAFDGTHYVLDAEPLGGSICRGLRRTDHCRLDHVRPVQPKQQDGSDQRRYHLLVRNEVEETQYLDEVSLLVFDHEVGTRIVPEIEGGFHEIGRTIAPTRAFDVEGRDLLPFFVAADEVSWQSHMSSAASRRPADPRHELTFSFPKPPHAERVNLIVNAGSSLWGSNMIREMLSLLGPQTGAWYRSIAEQGPELEALNAFLQRDELYNLKVLVSADDRWSQRGVIRASGPLVIEDQVVPLDIADVSSDSLTIRLRPPFGFWSMDYLAVEYETRATPHAVEVHLRSALDSGGADVTDLLQAADDCYYTMPAVGDWASLTFDVAPRKAGTERTVFLRASGYYEIQLPGDLLNRSDLLVRLFAVPDACVGFALDKYMEWRAGLQAEGGHD